MVAYHKSYCVPLSAFADIRFRFIIIETHSMEIRDFLWNFFFRFFSVKTQHTFSGISFQWPWLGHHLRFVYYPQAFQIEFGTFSIWCRFFSVPAPNKKKAYLQLNRCWCYIWMLHRIKCGCQKSRSLDLTNLFTDAVGGILPHILFCNSKNINNSDSDSSYKISHDIATDNKNKVK